MDWTGNRLPDLSGEQVFDALMIMIFGASLTFILVLVLVVASGGIRR